MQTLSVKLSAELFERLGRRARELNRPKSEIVRQALWVELNSGKQFVSLLDRAGDLVGKYAGRRKDSSHKKHLKTFGLKSAGRLKGPC